MKKQITLVLVTWFICNLGAFAQDLPVKKILPVELQSSLAKTGDDGAKDISTLTFDPAGDYTVEISSTVSNVTAAGRGMDFEVRSGSGMGFRTSLSENSFKWAAPFSASSEISATEGGKQVARYAVKGDQAYVYLNGNYINTFNLASIGDMDGDGTTEVPIPFMKSDNVYAYADMYDDVNLITNPDFKDDTMEGKPTGWVSNQGMGSGVARVSGNNSQVANYETTHKAFYIRYETLTGSYYSYAVTLKPDTWYEYSYDLIVWSGSQAATACNFDLVVSTVKEGTSGIVYSQVHTSPTVLNTAERHVARFKTAPSENVTDTYYIVYKQKTDQKNIGITDLYLEEKTIGGLLFGKNYTDGVADIHIDYIRVDYTGAFAPLSDLPEKENLSVKLQSSLDIGGADEAKDISALTFEPAGNYTVEVSSTVSNVTNGGRGMDLEMRSGSSGMGFRTSLSENSFQWAAPFSASTEISSTEGGTQVARYAVKDDQVYVYLNGNFVDIFNLASIGDMNEAGSEEIAVSTEKPEDMYDDGNLIANPDFAGDNVNTKPTGWEGATMGSGVARVQVREDGTSGSGYTDQLSAYDNGKHAFFVRFETLAVGTYYAYKVSLKPDTWYEYSFDLIAWGANGRNIDFDFIVSKQANGASDIITTQHMTSPSVAATPQRCVVRFKTASSESETDVYYLVYKKPATGNTNQNIGITDLYLQEKSIGHLLVGKNYTDGTADIHIDYIRVDYTGAFAPGSGAITDYVIDPDTEKTAEDYLSSGYHNLIFNKGSQLTGIDEEGLTVHVVVKYQLTVAKDRWYAIGFPFDIATVYSHYFAEQDWDAELYPKGSETSNDYWLRTYDGDQFNTAEAIEAGKGYIIQFPEWQDGKVISFISKPEITLHTGATSLPADENYRLLNNPALQSLTLSPDDNNLYYCYNPAANSFDLLEASASLNPFEAAIAIQKTSAPQNAPKQILIEADFTTIEKPAISVDDPVIVTRYYTLQGTAIYQPVENGVYIVKNIRQSGQEEITKIVYLKK
jgi:hypothetical protein